MSAENERLRRHVDMFGTEGLSRADQWRLRDMEFTDRRKGYLVEEQRRREERAAVVAVSDGNAALRGEVAALRAECERLNDELAMTQEGTMKFFDTYERHESERGEVFRQLKSEIASLKVELAAVRAEGLKSLHDNLVASARMAIDTCNEVTNYNARRVETAQSEATQREELVALQARADALAAELERLRTHRDFKFAREEGDSDVFDLPHFLPPPRRDN